MASKKDMRRADLIVPYAEPEKSKDENDIGSTLSSTLPMAAAWLAESPEQKKTSSTPAFFQVGMSGMYLPSHAGIRLCANAFTAMSLLVQPLLCNHQTTPPNSIFSTPKYSADYSRHPYPHNPPPTRAPTDSRMSIENLKTFDPFAEADEDTGQVKQTQQDYIHIRIQQRNGRKTLTTVQGLPKKFDQKKILKVIKKKFACNGTIVSDAEMGEVVQLQGDQRKDVQDFLTDKKEGLGLDAKTIKVHGF
ncbi:Eukaryotic translation initiation factor SUI1 [Stemphylium lycopersici]|nr:Eukaryotic translation initiation factor SUI1 [Stemphylium lycopersici]